MDQKELKVNVDADTKTLVIREGEAEVIHQDEKVEITGAINSPWKFFKERMIIGDSNGIDGMPEKIQNDMKRSHLVFSYLKKYIVLVMVENNPIKYIIKGNLVENPNIKKLQVNTEKKFSSKELSQLLRFNKFFFADKDENRILIENLQKVKMKIQTEIENETSQTGNKRELYDVKVANGDMKLDFNLSLPLFIGQPDVKFKVEICIDVRERDIEFWLESPELAELIETKTREIMDVEIKQFEGKGLVIIEQ